MRKKIWILSIAVAIALVLTSFPSIASQISKTNYNTLQTNVSEQNTPIENPKSLDIVKIKVIQIKENKKYEITVKELSKDDESALWKDLKNTEIKDYPSLAEYFEAKLEIIKNYNLVPTEFTLEDVIDVGKLGERYITVEGEDFEAAFAPILFVGGGLGFGLGIPFFITSGTFLFLLLGFGLTMCYDYLNGILYKLMTFSFIPILMGYLSGFTGLLLLPVVPGLFYSNALGIGMSAITIWKQLPSY
jgi:hypothetical protein